MCKYIFITGGVVSSLGKGITAASLGRLLINRGLKVIIQKLDPYINIDPGTMSPYQHGEVFVTEDGSETDLDVGHYERFLNINSNKFCNYTSGKIYSSVISRERKGEYLGATIQVVPHITNEIKNTIKKVGQHNIDIVIVEIGGTVGDIESLPFLEAIRQLRIEMGEENSLFMHVTLLPYLEAAGEVKTKPTQHSVKELTGLGIQPDIIICRTNKDIEMKDEFKKKIALFCNLRETNEIIHNPDCKSIYEVPLILKEQKLDDIVLKKLKIKAPKCDVKKWQKMVTEMKQPYPELTIAIVGKYIQVPDAYISVTEALKHAGLINKHRINVKLIDSEDVEKFGAEKILSNIDGIVVPGGFGDRGVEGKIMTAKFARENKIPYLGLCLGMQIAIIEFARNVAMMKGANSTEFDPKTKYPVIDIMEEQKKTIQNGTTMRLGSYDCKLFHDTQSYMCYKKPIINERHRHKFEFNNKYKSRLIEKGLIIGGVNEQMDLVEIIELKNHPFFVGVQFHPEFKSRPYEPHPLFIKLIEASSKK